MTDLFMAVMSCRRDQENGCTKWFRATNGSPPMSYRIFVGNGATAIYEDEVILPVDDSYACLPWKVQTAFRWALNYSTKWTYLLKVDSDTQIWFDRLLPSEFESYDYVGNFFDGHVNPISRTETYAMGPGYWVSRAAAEKVVVANISSTVENHHGVYWEDEFVGKVLADSRRFHSERYPLNLAGRKHMDASANPFLLGNAFDNRGTAVGLATDHQTSLNIWAAETRARREGKE